MDLDLDSEPNDIKFSDPKPDPHDLMGSGFLKGLKRVSCLVKFFTIQL